MLDIELSHAAAHTVGFIIALSGITHMRRRTARAGPTTFYDTPGLFHPDFEHAAPRRVRMALEACKHVDGEYPECSSR